MTIIEEKAIEEAKIAAIREKTKVFRWRAPPVLATGCCQVASLTKTPHFCGVFYFTGLLL
jgi:hypothetical protein